MLIAFKRQRKTKLFFSITNVILVPCKHKKYQHPFSVLLAKTGLKKPKHHELVVVNNCYQQELGNVLVANICENNH